MSNYLYLDTETFSPIPIDYGCYKYVEKAELLLFPYAYNENPVKIWDCTATPMPKDLKYYLSIPDLPWVAHNSQFDRVILEKLLGIYHRPWIDTMVIAYQHALPAKLAQLCEVYKLSQHLSKNKTGQQLIDLFCKPQGKNRKIKRCTRETHPAEWRDFIDYAKSDIASMREIFKRLPKWNCTKEEYRVWQLDQKINERGIQIDYDLCVKAEKAVEDAKEYYNKRLSKITNTVVTKGTQGARIIRYIKDTYDIKIPNMQAPTIIDYLKKDIPDGVKELLKIRQNTSKSSTAKYIKMINSVNSDNRIRGTLQYCGASKTGRWAGRNIQPQNFPRPEFKEKEIEKAIDLLKRGELKEDVPLYCSSMLRGAIISAKGKKLVVPDYASIEGRVLMWLAQEKEALKKYINFDKGIGFDAYVNTYADTFKINPKDVTKDQRQIGKPLSLAFGYQGGVGAFLTFAKSYNINVQKVASMVSLPPDIIEQAEWLYHKLKEWGKPAPLDIHTFTAIDGMKRLWRNDHPHVVQYWKDVEEAAKNAILGYPSYVNNCYFDMKKRWLRIRLPSGRYLQYPNAKVIDDKIQYWHYKYGVDHTYGGPLVENITQAGARDILVFGIFEAEKYGYELVFTVHDELVTEVPDTKEYSLQHLLTILNLLPDWAYGLPLPADGFEGCRYKKED